MFVCAAHDAAVPAFAISIPFLPVRNKIFPSPGPKIQPIEPMDARISGVLVGSPASCRSRPDGVCGGWGGRLFEPCVHSSVPPYLES